MNITQNINSSAFDENFTKPENIMRLTDKNGGIPTSFYVSLGSMYIPGAICNLVSLIIIGKDIKSVSMPTNLLLFVLCFTDLLAIINSLIWHLIRYSVFDLSENVCSLKSVLGTFFPLYSGIAGMLMAMDRFLAICAPFFYKQKVSPRVWCFVSILAATVLFFLCCFPVFGIGTIWTFRGRSRTCSTIAYHTIPYQRIFGYTYSCLGLLIVAAIFMCNAAVIYTAVKLHMKLTTVTLNNASSSTEQQSISSELQFARLVGVLTFVFVICWTPFNVTIILKELSIKVDADVLSFIHRLAGFNYVIDPLVYIFMRKSCRQKIKRFVRRHICNDNSIDVEI